MADVEKQDQEPGSRSPNGKLQNGQRSSRALERTTTDPHYGDFEDLESDDSDDSPSISKTPSRFSRTDNSLAQTTSRASRRLDTAVLSRIRSRAPIGSFSHPLEHAKTTVDDLVDFDGPNDPYHPVNWPMKKKIITTFLYGMTTMAASWASATYSAGQSQVQAEFDVGWPVATLGTTCYLFGFGLGPLLWAPLSEVYGRKSAVIPPMFVAACFSFGSATSKDIQTLIITRFFAGIFASAPVSNTGGVLADLFPPSQRGIAIAAYAMAVVLGPVFGPIVGAAFVVNPSLRWRWTEYFTGIYMLVITFFDMLILDETYPPRLLITKASRLRHQSGNYALHAKFEEWDISISELAHKFLLRPFQLIRTPICASMVLYASFCYGILYMCLGAIPIIFGEKRGWPLVSSELPFLGLLVGVVLGCAMNVWNQLQYNKKAQGRTVPELRLPPMMVGSFAFTIGLFIVGWTADPSYPWIAPVIGLTCAGFGFFTIFQACLNYLVDTFTKYAASAIAANTFMRSCFAGAFPLVVRPLYGNVGVPWGTSIFGFFALALVPVPFIFWRYGKSLRARSVWSRESIGKE